MHMDPGLRRDDGAYKHMDPGLRRDDSAYKLKEVPFDASPFCFLPILIHF